MDNNIDTYLNDRINTSVGVETFEVDEETFYNASKTALYDKINSMAEEELENQ